MSEQIQVLAENCLIAKPYKFLVNIGDELCVLELMVLVKYGGGFELENYRTLLLTPALPF